MVFVPRDKEVCPYSMQLSHFTSQDSTLLGAPQAGTSCGFILCHWYLGTGRCEIKACRYAIPTCSKDWCLHRDCRPLHGGIPALGLTGQGEKEGEPVKGKQEGEIKRGKGSVSKEGKRKKDEREDRTENQ